MKDEAITSKNPKTTTITINYAHQVVEIVELVLFYADIPGRYERYTIYICRYMIYDIFIRYSYDIYTIYLLFIYT